ncbi:hypothetical protein KJS94_12680 [Flavihumibacter rivuli]|uniref:adenylate/guanylate cyclase domain-containing protein n=1 Tax=Flavihumibacter rivuli TaxID=2838156 RepID=UPI001BDF6C0F|nr:adenylate/guanylate cyclase domain-containing protein [Flavihumibacter rivuli]ULQ55499.1 hypothetical protein KJS94_12680 [Flavihumibacter rivuli]
MTLQSKALALLLGPLLLFIQNIHGQDQKIADSLAIIYRHGTVQGNARLELLRDLAFNETSNLKLALRYADELIRLADSSGNQLYLHRGYLQKGNKLRLLGGLSDAQAAYFKSLEAAQKANYILGESMVYGSIADVYSSANDHNNAIYYYNRSISALRKLKDSTALGSAIFNASDEYIKRGRNDSALTYLKEAGTIFDKIQHKVGKAYVLGSMGMAYAQKGQNQLAEQQINEAISLLEGMGTYLPISEYLLTMADIYNEKKELPRAIGYADRSLLMARQYGLKDMISKASLKLSEIYEQSGNTAAAFAYYKQSILYRDSVNDINGIQRMADLRTTYEVSRKQAEVDLLNQQKKTQLVRMFSMAVILVLTIAFLLYSYKAYLRISKEKKRSEGLLLNILPASIAQELKANGKVNAVKFNEVTVLFTDFVQFTRAAEKVEAEQLVQSIDFYYKKFDEITSKFGLEKIKTIGDSYMCAGGLPISDPDHVRKVIMAAKEMMTLASVELSANDGIHHFELRIGIHTGPVVAGIVGIKKWQYDIWGDTVNIASRMESMSIAGKINLSESTYQKIRNEFPCEYRGEIEIKNHGPVKMYYLL